MQTPYNSEAVNSFFSLTHQRINVMLENRDSSGTILTLSILCKWQNPSINYSTQNYFYKTKQL